MAKAMNESNEDYRGDEDIEVTDYKEMTKAELIKCLEAHDAHHQEHHEAGEILEQVKDGWIETFTGRQFHFSAEDPDEVAIEDIAHALSLLNRYNGHTQRPYSVAEHCVLMAQYVESVPGTVPADVLTTLLHDASEAYIGDMTRPLKGLFPQFKVLEEKIHELVALKFDTQYPHPDWLKELDMRILTDERAQAMDKYSSNDWGLEGVQPLGVQLRFWSPREAEREFILVYRRCLQAMIQPIIEE